MRKNFYLLIFTSLIMLLVIEVILRLFWANPYAGSGTDEILKLRVPHKNISQKLNRRQIDTKYPFVMYRTNDRNYVEPVFSFDKPDLTIAFLGGSTTECIAVREQKRFPFLVSKLLEEKGLKVNSLNIARSGGTLHDSINVLLNHVILERPDIVIVMHAVNDIGMLKKDDDYSSRMGHDVTGANICKYVLQMISSRSSLAGFCREAQLKIFGKPDKREAASYSTIRIEDYEPFKDRLEAYVGICEAFDIIPVLMTQPHAGNIKNELTPGWSDPNAQDVFNQVIRNVGYNTGAEVIDLAKYISKNTKNKDDVDRIFYDGVHVTDYGSEVYAAHITENINKKLDLSGIVEMKTDKDLGEIKK